MIINAQITAADSAKIENCATVRPVDPKGFEHENSEMLRKSNEGSAG